MVIISPLQIKQAFFRVIVLPFPIRFSALLPSTALIFVNFSPRILFFAIYLIPIFCSDNTIPFSIVLVATTTANVLSTFAGKYICHEFESAQVILIFTFLRLIFSGIFALRGTWQGLIIILGSICATEIDIFPSKGGGILF